MRNIIIASLFSLVIVFDLSAKNLYIPIAGITPGRNGTFWRTDLRIYNPSTIHDIEVTLHFLVANRDGSNISGRVFPIRRGEVLILENVVAAIAPEFDHAIGAIRIDSDTDASYEFVATSRTYTNSPNTQQPGTYGQFVPALDPADATRKTVVLNVANRPDVRTNFGAMNPGRTEVTLRATLYGFDGMPFLESLELSVPPMSMRQWSLDEIFGAAYISEAYVVFEASQPVFTWAAVVDNMSGDSMFVRGIEPVADVKPLP